MARRGNNDDTLKDAKDMLGGEVDVERGIISPFGIRINVGTGLATVIEPFYDQILNDIQRGGSKVAYRQGYKFVKGVGASNPVAYKAARVLEFLWGFGPTVLDFGLNTRKSITTGYQEMQALREMLAPHLAANNTNAGITSLMSDSNRGVQNVRAFVMKKSKNSLLSNFTGFVAKVPNLALVYWQQKLDDLNNPQRAGDAFVPEDTQKIEERLKQLDLLKEPRAGVENNLMGRLGSYFDEISKTPEFEQWKRVNPGGSPLQYASQHSAISLAKKLYAEASSPGDLKQLGKQVAMPKHANELEMNLSMLRFFPAIGGVLSRWLRERLIKPDERRLEDFAVVRTAKLAERLKKDPTEDRRELAEQISSLFLRHFRDCGNSEDLSRTNYQKLGKITEELAEAVVDRGMNPYALVDLICGDKLAKYDRGEFIFTSTHERAELIEKEAAKYAAKVDNKELTDDIGVTQEDLKKIYAALGPEERAFFVMLFPPGVLEQQGIDKTELAEIRKANRDEFLGVLSQFLADIKDMSSADLKQKYNIPEDAAKMLLSVAEDFVEASGYGRGEGGRYLAQHQREVAKTVAKAGLTSGDPNFWRRLVGGDPEQAEEQKEEARADVREKPMPSSRRPVSGRSLKEHARDRGGDDDTLSPQ